jgi:hypothetical protein
MGFTGTVARTDPDCRCAMLRVTFDLAHGRELRRPVRWSRRGTDARSRVVFPAHSVDQRVVERLLATVPHPVRTL